YHLPMPAPATSLRLSLPTRRSSVRSACEAARRVLAASGIRLLGLHSHIGSQIFDTAGFEVAARRVLTLHARLGAELGYVPGELRSEEHTSELQSRFGLVCRLLPAHT